MTCIEDDTIADNPLRDGRTDRCHNPRRLVTRRHDVDRRRDGPVDQVRIREADTARLDPNQNICRAHVRDWHLLNREFAARSVQPRCGHERARLRHQRVEGVVRHGVTQFSKSGKQLA